MNNHVLVWDLETVPDHPCVARVHGCPEGDDEAARQALGDKFPKLYLHKIACIGALIAERRDGIWHVLSLGAPHMGERTEAEMLTAFVGRIADFRPQLIAWNCGGFDLPVLRYRAIFNRVPAPGLESRRYWYRYGDDCLDLCDALACYETRGKVSLNDLCRALGFPGKPVGIDGGEVDRYVQEGRVGEVAAYCETDVVSTYRVWLVHELFRGTLSKAEFEESEANPLRFLRERVGGKPHLAHVLAVGPDRPPALHHEGPVLAASRSSSFEAAPEGASAVLNPTEPGTHPRFDHPDRAQCDFSLDRPTA